MSTWHRSLLPPGVYEEIVSKELKTRLLELEPRFHAELEPIPATGGGRESILALLSDGIDLALAELHRDRDRTLSFAQSLLGVLQQHAPKTFQRSGELELAPEVLRAVTATNTVAPARPRGSLHASRLIVNAQGENLIDYLKTEFDSADRIDLICAFIKLSGLEKLRHEIERHCSERGRILRVLTTTYMGASEARAIEWLSGRPNTQIRISYDDNSTRLHAKAWLFHRDSGYSTAYVGSSNLSHSAQTDGLEWNVRLTSSDQAAVVEQIRETFEQYWEDGYQFEPFDHHSESHRLRLIRALSTSGRHEDSGDLIEIHPKDFQRPILDELKHARRLGRHTNLLVAATGTGKTIMAALDYRGLRESGSAETLLYVAHRREILAQARRAFRHVLQERHFGELYHQGEKPAVGRHVFASIDSLGEESSVDPASFDMVVLDEAHHTAANSWHSLLDRIRPKELLGLTGTPERADGLDYEDNFPRPWIGNLRVWDAIPHALVPFRYYMLDVDGVDLADVEWVRGRYAPEALAGRLLGAADIFVKRACTAIVEHIARPAEIRAIAFCVNVRHAEVIAGRLEDQGYRVAVLTGATQSDKRRQAQAELDSGRIQILCVVDIYNEGVDVPNVNTVFFFRPTESATVFLQQLGRGLRRTPSKAELVVFDLTCRQHRQFRFDRRLRALIGNTPRELQELVHKGFGRLPAGCLLHFDEISQREVLAQIKQAIPTNRRGILEILRDPVHADLSLKDFLHETDIELEDVYARKWSWTLARREARLISTRLEDAEVAALQNLSKLLHVSDDRRISTWERLLALEKPGDERSRRVERMLFVILYGEEAEQDGSADSMWPQHGVLRGELSQLIPVLRVRAGVLAEAYELDPDNPLVLHARYLSLELSAAFDRRTTAGKLFGFATGVEPVANRKFDLLLVTAHKDESVKEHLRFRDFAMNPNRFHWQSQSDTTQDSRKGRRHLDAERENCLPLLLVREKKKDARGLTLPFQFLGPVDLAAYEGERPISIQWELRYSMPLPLFHATRVAA